MSNSKSLAFAPARLAPRPRYGFVTIWRLIKRAAVSRGDLAMLDDRMLRDIGLTRGQAAAEASRLPWDLTPRRPDRRD